MIQFTLYAEDMWNTVLEAGKKHNLMVIAPAHHRRIQALFSVFAFDCSLS